MITAYEVVARGHVNALAAEVVVVGRHFQVDTHRFLEKRLSGDFAAVHAHRGAARRLEVAAALHLHPPPRLHLPIRQLNVVDCALPHQPLASQHRDVGVHGVGEGGEGLREHDLEQRGQPRRHQRQQNAKRRGLRCLRTRKLGVQHPCQLHDAVVPWERRVRAHNRRHLPPEERHDRPVDRRGVDSGIVWHFIRRPSPHGN
mmetsp:Transcript_31660/g.56670  ORF Transcript_31660/g.56670 Transcript_31660/m.56670 type:complete len:201 (+) Transcript_31660:1117-1719(+)